MKLVHLCVVLTLGAPASALAYPGQGVPNPRYPDGTGNDVVDQLNAAQLDGNYHGPTYYRGQLAPPAQPLRPQAVYPPVYPPPGYGAGLGRAPS